MASLKPADPIDFSPDYRALLAEAATRPDDEDAWPTMLEAYTLLFQASWVGRHPGAGDPPPAEAFATLFRTEDPDVGALGWNDRVDFTVLPPLNLPSGYGDVTSAAAAYEWYIEHEPPDLPDRLAQARWMIPASWRSSDKALARRILPHAGATSLTVALYRVRFLRAVEADDVDEALRMLRAVRGLASVMMTQLSAIEQGVGYRALGHMHGDLIRHFLSSTPSAQMIDALTPVIETPVDARSSVDRIRAEQILHDDYVQRVFSKGGPGGGVYLPATNKRVGGNEDLPPATFFERIGNVQGFLAPSRDELDERTEAYVADLKEHIRQRSTYDRSQLYWDSLVATWPELMSLLESDGIILTPFLQYPMQFGKTYARARRVTAVLMLRLEKYRHEHGAYPTTLDLVTGEPPTAHCQAILYRATPSPDDPLARPYLLYVAGKDDTDDGGAIALDGRHTFRSTPVGADYILNAPRED